MRTTVDLPPAVHARAKALAEERGTSLSAVIADLTARGLAGLGEPIEIRTHPDTAWPTVAYGRPLSAAEVADLIDDE